MAKRISDNATAATKRRKDVAKTGAGAFPQPKETKSLLQSNQKTESPILGIKRPRVTDSSGDPPPKRIAADVAVGGKTPSAQSKPVLTKRSSSGSDAKPLAAATVVPKKPTQVVPKPSTYFTNNFSGLQSAKRSTTATPAAAKPSAIIKSVAPRYVLPLTSRTKLHSELYYHATRADGNVVSNLSQIRQLRRLQHY